MANPLQERFAETLLDRIRKDNYPSVTQMDLLEEVAPPRVMVEFVLDLMQRIEDDNHPSIPLMLRARRLIKQFGT